MIKVENLHKTYRIRKQKEGPFSTIKSLIMPEFEYKQAINGISFTIKRGEVVGYIGRNGAGKSTTIKILSGILSPTSGVVLVDGVIPHRERKKHLQHIGVVRGQKSSLWWDVPVLDSFNIIKEIYDINEKKYKHNLELFVNMLDMKSFIQQPVRLLSLGQRVKADFAAALLHDPDILFLDEPTIGVDVLSKEYIRNFIQHVNKEYGTTVLLTTHDMADMEKLAKRVIFINSGSIICDIEINELKRKYRNGKIIKMFFDGKVPNINSLDLKTLERGENFITLQYNGEKMTTELIPYLLQLETSPIVDISIQDEDIESIIRNIYRGDR